MDVRGNLNCKSTLLKMKGRLCSWKSKVLSFAGKVTLVKYVLNSIPNYPMQVMKFPKYYCDDIDKINRLYIAGD